MSDGKCRVQKGSTDADGGTQNEIDSANPGQGVLMGIEEWLSSGAALPCIVELEGG